MLQAATDSMSGRGLYVLKGLREIKVLTFTGGSGQPIGKHPMWMDAYLCWLLIAAYYLRTILRTRRTPMPRATGTAADGSGRLGSWPGGIIGAPTSASAWRDIKLKELTTKKAFDIKGLRSSPWKEKAG